MRFRTVEIRWHDSKPISSCDFQPVPFKKARPPPTDLRAFGGQSYRLATSGEDNHVRLWSVYPYIRPSELDDADGVAPARPARVEYLATLSRHSAAVNVVRFSPNGELIASAGDDGMIILWAQSSTPQASTYGSDLSAEDLQHEKEYWKPRTTFRCTTMQVYDLAWSPTGEYLLAGSTDNAARVFAAADGKCVHEIAEHLHYVQGVAWDPLNEYIATQSSDRSMHVYRISTNKGTFEAHAVGRNTRFPNAARGRTHSRTPSVHPDDMLPSASSTDWSRPSLVRSTSIESDRVRDQDPGTPFPSTPASIAAATPFGAGSSSAAMFPPPPAGSTSRRSSFSGSNAPNSPGGFSATSGFSRAYGRSPSPMPALPAIRTPPNASAGWAGRYEERSASRGRGRYDERRYTDGARMYGDEGYSNFFRRLAFSPDGGLLLLLRARSRILARVFLDGIQAPQTARPSISTTDLEGQGDAKASNSASSSTVYVYSRANFARPPVAQLPGHKKASVAVRFNPVLFELRPGLSGGAAPTKTAEGTATGEENDEKKRDVEETIDIDLVGPTATPIAAPTPQQAVPASPALSPTDRRPPTPAASKPPSPGPSQTMTTPIPPPPPSIGTGSIFALPYRMLYAVVTMDSVAIYDTQQAGPVCLLSKLHYDEFTDLSWSPDGQCLILAARDGYCTLVTFDEILPPHHTQQTVLQLQQIAAQHSVPILVATPSSSGSGRKRPLEPLTPAASVDGDREKELGVAASLGLGGMTPSASATSVADSVGGTRDGDPPPEGDGPPKKKRRVALTKVADL
ncbi:WD-REPEATS-REGION domain-containing protein [Mycena kentingensis (nom. inval.)]|nr:WD-REPEATS-REGION domain-containing protein [Mycena kentingensis (nom. inval.)]